MKNNSWMILEKDNIKWEKTPYCNYKKLFTFAKSDLLSDYYNNIM